jgi:hypothetical protein
MTPLKTEKHLAVESDIRARARFQSLPKPIQDLLIRYPGELVLAGGYLRDREANMDFDDVDIFILKGENGFINPYLIAKEIEHTEEHKTPNSLTLRGCQYNNTIQLISLYEQEHSPAALLSKFDFACCRVALWHNGAQPYCIMDTHFKHDCLNKKLRYRHGDNPANSMRRVLKLYKRGWTISDKSLADVAADLCNGDGEYASELFDTNNRSHYA